MEYILTRHAQERLDKCGLTIDQVILTIKKGAKIKQTDGFIAVHTYIRVAYVIREERCEITERSSILEPYSLLQIGALLREDNHHIELIDANGFYLNFNSISTKIKKGFDAIIFRFTPTTFDHDLKITNRFRKKNPEGIIIGICFTLKTLWKEIMKEADLDIFITGDYEVVIKDLFTNFQNYSNIKGIAYKKNKKIFHNEYIRNGFDYDSLGIPAYNLLKNFNFYKINANTNEIFSIIYTSKGCPYKCNFCNVANTHLKTKSVDLVINEIKVLKDYGVQLISFFDEKALYFTWLFIPISIFVKSRK